MEFMCGATTDLHITLKVFTTEIHNKLSLIRSNAEVNCASTHCVPTALSVCMCVCFCLSVLTKSLGGTGTMQADKRHPEEWWKTVHGVSMLDELRDRVKNIDGIVQD